MITAFIGDEASFENENTDICRSITAELPEQERIYAYAVAGDPDPDPGSRAAAADALCREAQADGADLLILLCSPCSREYGGRLARKLGIRCVPNAEHIESSGGGIVITVPAYNGALSGTVRLSPGEKAVIIMDSAAKAAEPAGPEDGPAPEIKKIVVPDTCSGTERERRVSEDTDTDDISLENRIVLCGHAFSKKEQTEEIKRFEELSGITYGGSRPVITDGLMSASRLTGMSGKILKADKCLVLGASGAAAFRTGIRYCREVIAVNTDRDAPVFGVSRYGAVCDCHAVLKEMNRLLEERNGTR